MPDFLAGHSLGEYTALVCAEAISFRDAVKLVAARGRFMQAAVPAGKGALAAIIGLDQEKLLEICQQQAQHQVLSPANYNSLGQIVLAGDKEAVERALVAAKQAGAKLAKLLPVSVPSHCALMRPAATHLTEYLQQVPIEKPKLPVVNNVDVKLYNTAEDIREGLTRQLFMPVRWVEIIQFLAHEGVQQVTECGPGKVLTGLNKRITDKIEFSYIDRSD